MQYEARAAAVEAERITLAGQEMAAVAVAGKTCLVPADVFDLFFALRDAVAGMKAVVKPSRAPEGKPTARPKNAESNPLAGARKITEATLRNRLMVINTLREFGPLTTSELATRFYPDNSNTEQRFKQACAVLARVAKDGLIAKDEDTLQWHLKK